MDASHSTVEFSIPFLGHVVRGRFDDVQGTIVHAVSTDGAPGVSAVSVTIGTSSINTGSRHRDEHLRSDDFLDAEHYPIITFHSVEITQRIQGYAMRGTLSMYGIVRPITVMFRPTEAPVDDPHGSTLIHFQGSTRLGRREFGVLGGDTHNNWFDAARSATMGDSVDVTLDIAGWRTDFTRIKQYDASVQRIAAYGVDSALARVRTAVERNPAQLSDIRYEAEQLASALIAHGNVAEAVALLKGTMQLASTSPDGHAALARAYEAAGNRDAARAEVKRTLDLAPSHPRALEIMRRLGKQRPGAEQGPP